MLRFSNKGIENIEQVLDSLPNQYASINVIDLSNNKIKEANIDMLPEFITNVNLQNNLINEINWDDRQWGTINLRDNSLDFDEISNLYCERLDMSKNMIEDITFIDCEINQLILEENSIKIINFVNCKINKLVISKNKISEITHLPDDITHLVANKNRIKKVCALPNTILILELGNNQIDSLVNIPENVVKLDLSHNNFTHFDINQLPVEILDFFDISHNKFTNNEETFGPLKKNIEELYYDDDIEPQVKNDNISTGSTSSTSTFTSSTSSGSSAKLSNVVNTGDDSDSDLSIKVVRNKKIESDDEGGSELEKEFVKINAGTRNMRLSEDSDSDDDISKQIRQFTMKKMNEYHDISNIQSIQNDFEQKRFQAYNAALERAKMFENAIQTNQTNQTNTENSIDWSQFNSQQNIGNQPNGNQTISNQPNGNQTIGNQVILTEEQKEIIDILKHRNLKKNLEFSSRTPINISWSFTP